MPIPFLPKLRQPQPGETGHELNLPDPGVWDDEQGKRRMGMLADAIEVPPGADRVHSIPDPWARVILFRRALFDRDHTLHPQVRDEWRGLMGLIAMRYVGNFHQLGIAQVRLGADPNAGFEEEQEERAEGSFRSVLGRVLPGNKDAISQEASWSLFHILRWTGDRTNGLARAFALTSPLTLVATGADYSKVLTTSEVPWFVGGKLTDPGKYLHKGHKALLAEWLLHVFKGLPVGEGTKSTEIGECLKRFATDLDKAQKGNIARSRVFSSRPLGLSGVRIFKDINLPCLAPASKITDCALKGKAEGPPYLIVIDPSIATQMGKSNQDVFVFNPITAARVAREVPDTQTRSHGFFAPGQDGIPGAEWCTADYFFERDLIFEQNRPLGGAAPTEAFPGCRSIRTEGNSDYRHFALPIRSEALRWMSADELVENLSMVWLPSGEAKFELTLTLDTLEVGDEENEEGSPPASGTEEGDEDGQRPAPARRTGKVVRWANRPQKIVLERTYGREDRVRVDLLPALCLWPNFYFEDEKQKHANGQPQPPTNRWSRYYLFESWRGGSDTNQMMVHAFGAQGAASRLTKLRSHSENGENDDPFKVTLLTRYPEVLVCTMPPNKNRPAGRSDGAPSGLLILEKPAALRVMHSGRRVLGLDFGTTGTTIYSAKRPDAGQKNEGTPERLVFENRLKQITNWDSSAFQRLTRELFLPNTQPAFGRILTVFQDFGAESQPQPVMDGHVLFLENAGLQRFVHGDPASIRTALKWGEDPRDNIAAQNFLIQLGVQSLAELVARGASEVELRYSYPTAFSLTDLERFMANWSAVHREMQASTSVPVEFRLSLKDPNLGQYSEAICATQFFSHPTNSTMMDPGQGGITLDIGGGTTDIAVWNKHPDTRDPSLLAHTSVKFAGQDIFLAPVRQRPDVLARIDNGGDVAKAIAGLNKRFSRQTSENAYFAELDAIISSYSDRLLSQLPPYAESPGVKQLLSLIQFGLCGVGFYSGLILGTLVKDGLYHCTSESLPVFVGGNGSRLFKWCQLGVPMEDSEAITRFKEALLGGASFAMGSSFPVQEVEVILSKLPKEEVAFGLVRETAGIVPNNTYVHRIVGENYQVGTTASLTRRSWDTQLDTATLASEPVDVDPEMPVFRAFLKSIGQEADPDEIKRASSSVNADLRRMAKAAKAAQQMKSKNGKTADPLRRQPLFIFALDSYVALKVQEIASLQPETPR